MQKLEKRRKTNTPTDAPQVRSNCGLQLNKEETLSVASLKTFSNNPEVDLSQHHTGRLKAVVYVLSITGEPLMPCSFAKTKRLLKKKRANVVKLYPFTIKLNFVCENKTQSIKLGIDSGYENIGFSAVTEKKELISGTLILDSKTSSRLTEKAMYRRGRRNRHHWYRKPRFLNRKKNEGWLPPSVQRRYDTHLNLIKKLKSVLPILKVTIEIAKFDIQKIENDLIEGVEYQQGNMYGYQNVRSYLLAREKGLCQLCGKEFTKGQPSHLHHCKQKGEQGSNRPENLALLHKKCHHELHAKGLKLPAPKQYKASTFMSIINKRFRKDIPDVKITFGYITFVNRNKLGLEKTHYNDAFVITHGTTQERCLPITIKQKHRNSRVLQLNRNGFKPSVRKQRYHIQPKDLIWIDNKKLVVSGTHNNGSRVIAEGTKKSYPVKKIQKSYHFGSFAYNIN